MKVATAKSKQDDHRSEFELSPSVELRILQIKACPAPPPPPPPWFPNWAPGEQVAPRAVSRRVGLTPGPRTAARPGRGLTGFQDEADAVDERAGVGHHLRGGQQVPEARQPQGQAAAVQACLQVQAQRDVLVDQMPGERLWAKVDDAEGGPLPPSCCGAAREAGDPAVQEPSEAREAGQSPQLSLPEEGAGTPTPLRSTLSAHPPKSQGPLSAGRPPRPAAPFPFRLAGSLGNAPPATPLPALSRAPQHRPLPRPRKLGLRAWVPDTAGLRLG